MADIIAFPTKKLSSGTTCSGAHVDPEQARMEAIRDLLGVVFDSLSAIKDDLADLPHVRDRSSIQ